VVPQDQSSLQWARVYDVVARTYLPHMTGTVVLAYCRGLAASLESFWPTLNPKRLAEKMVLASQDLDERVS
jgi:hypothetical protein